MRDLQSYIDEEYQKAPEEAMRLYDGKTIDERGELSEMESAEELTAEPRRSQRRGA